MLIRARFEQKLNELRDEILKMGSMVDEEMKLALTALETFDKKLARQVYKADKAVNDTRFAIRNLAGVRSSGRKLLSFNSRST